MKIKHLILAAAAIFGVAVACQKNSDVEEGVSVDRESIEFEAAGGTEEVAITASGAWTISITDEVSSWLELSDKSGSGSTKITLRASKNERNDRSGRFTIKCGFYSVKVSVSQKGEQGVKVESQIEKLLALDGYGADKDKDVSLTDVWFVAKYPKNGIVSDGTAMITVFGECDGAVGDKGTLTGKLGNHSYRNQVVAPLSFTKSGTQEVNHGTAIELKDQIDTYDWQNSPIVYVHVVGTCRKNGTYYNIYLDNCSKDVSFASNTEDGSKYEDKDIDFYGYFVSGTSHVSVVPVGTITVTGEAAHELSLTVSAAQTQEGFKASWNEVEGAVSYDWTLYKGAAGGEVMAAETTQETSVQFTLVGLEPGQLYTLEVVAYDANDEDLISAEASFTARDMSGSEDEVTVTFTQEQLAAAACKDAKVDIDEFISFTNSSDYGTTTVTELRIYKGKTLTISSTAGAIVKIEMTCTANGTTKQGPGCWGAGAPAGYTFEAEGKNGEWVGEAQSVSFTATDNQVRIQELTVTYLQ